MKKIILLIVMVSVLIFVVKFVPYKSPAKPLPVVDPSWKSVILDDLTFFYPENLPTEYIHLVDWPPMVRVEARSFVCAEGREEVSLMGQTKKEIIGGREYCKTILSEGAAGSIYTHYTYTTAFGDQVAIFSFTLRSVQCANYDEPERVLCETERSVFDVNALLDRIVQTVQVL